MPLYFEEQEVHAVLSLTVLVLFFFFKCFSPTVWCRLNIPPHMLPQTSHPTTLSVLHTENPIVFNVLVDMVISCIFLHLFT
jgi:hypothetical protein